MAFGKYRDPETKHLACDCPAYGLEKWYVKIPRNFVICGKNWQASCFAAGKQATCKNKPVFPLGSVDFSFKLQV